ncbi:MAG: V-type ATP synthase subunit E [Anaerolineae bacterium]
MNATVSTKVGSVNAVRDAVISEVQREAREILEEARAKAADYRAKSEAETQKEVEQLLRQARQRAQREREQAVARARLEAQHLKLQRREQLLDAVFEAAEARLDEIPAREDYPALVSHLIREAALRLGGSDHTLVVHADARTQSVVAEILDDLQGELDIELEMGPPLREGLGIVVETQDGHRRYDNRLETRFTRLKEDLRAPVYRILKGEAAGE